MSTESHPEYGAFLTEIDGVKYYESGAVWIDPYGVTVGYNLTIAYVSAGQEYNLGTGC